MDEPEYIGEAVNVSQENAITPLEKQSVKIQAKAGASMYLTGIGKVKSKMVIEGGSSPVKFKTGIPLTFIVKSFDNKSDPLSIISIVKFETTKKQRKSELSSIGTFSGGSSNNQDYVAYKSKKYKDSSYEIRIDSVEAGEYGIIVSNPNALAN
ncbi:hypothetical protein, partial [Pedobacter jamesrossensis]